MVIAEPKAKSEYLGSRRLYGTGVIDNYDNYCLNSAKCVSKNAWIIRIWWHKYLSEEDCHWNSILIIEPPHDKTNKMTDRPAKTLTRLGGCPHKKA